MIKWLVVVIVVFWRQLYYFSVKCCYLSNRAWEVALVKLYVLHIHSLHIRRYMADAPISHYGQTNKKSLFWSKKKIQLFGSFILFIISQVITYIHTYNNFLHANSLSKRALRKESTLETQFSECGCQTSFVH